MILTIKGLFYALFDRICIHGKISTIPKYVLCVLIEVCNQKISYQSEKNFLMTLGA